MIQSNKCDKAQTLQITKCYNVLKVLDVTIF